MRTKSSICSSVLLTRCSSLSNRWLNANFVALFESLTYEIIALSTDNNMGTVIGGGMYSYGSYAQLQAQPNEGYHFVCWNDHDSSSTRFVLVEDDAVYVATFAASVSVAEHTTKNVSLYPNPTTDMVYVISDAVAKLEVLDLTGRVLLSNEGQNSVSMRGLPSGVYLVRIHVADAVVCRRVVKR